MGTLREGLLFSHYRRQRLGRMARPALAVEPPTPRQPASRDISEAGTNAYTAATNTGGGVHTYWLVLPVRVAE